MFFVTQQISSDKFALLKSPKQVMEMMFGAAGDEREVKKCEIQFYRDEKTEVNTCMVTFHYGEGVEPKTFKGYSFADLDITQLCQKLIESMFQHHGDASSCNGGKSRGSGAGSPMIERVSTNAEGEMREVDKAGGTGVTLAEEEELGGERQTRSMKIKEEGEDMDEIEL